MQGTIQKYSDKWVAFYHAEGKGPGSDDCDHYGDTTVWRMARAVSTNGGRTWTRPGYPNNVVVAGVGATASTGNTNAGTGRVVKVGNYLYMFFKTAHGPNPGPSGIQVARASVSSEGAPGSWKKYYCHPATLLEPAYCAFDEPGIGGKSTQIGGISEKARYIAWNTALDRWIGFDASGKRGFRLYASEVGAGATDEVQQRDALFDADGNPKRWMNWTDTYPLVSTATDKYVDQWGGDIRNRRSKQLYAYPSIGGVDGSSWLTGNTFYVYYVKLFPGDKFTHRYLFRRKVTVVPEQHRAQPGRADDVQERPGQALLVDGGTQGQVVPTRRPDRLPPRPRKGRLEAGLRLHPQGRPRPLRDAVPHRLEPRPPGRLRPPDEDRDRQRAGLPVLRPPEEQPLRIDAGSAARARGARPGSGSRCAA